MIDKNEGQNNDQHISVWEASCSFSKCLWPKLALIDSSYYLVYISVAKQKPDFDLWRMGKTEKGESTVGMLQVKLSKTTSQSIIPGGSGPVSRGNPHISISKRLWNGQRHIHGPSHTTLAYMMLKETFLVMVYFCISESRLNSTWACSAEGRSTCLGLPLTILDSAVEFWFLIDWNVGLRVRLMKQT